MSWEKLVADLRTVAASMKAARKELHRAQREASVIYYKAFLANPAETASPEFVKNAELLSKIMEGE